VFVEHARGDGVFLSLVVLAEVGWVLRAAYGWNRTTIHGRLSRLVRTRGVAFEDLGIVEAALERYLDGACDLADYLIVGRAKSIGAELLTFDRRLSRIEGVTLL
jgi:predicted nucleic-acid-binding protein